jgi:hypothetical protein
MKGICVRLLLVGLTSLTFGCSASPEKSVGGPLDRQDGSVATTSVALSRDQAGLSPQLVRCGFAIRDFRAIRDEYGRVHAIGEVENVGAVTRGVELQAALRDASGRLVSVGHFCPAAGNNIAPGETWPFTYSFGRQDQGVLAELRIVDAFRSMGGSDAVAGAW